MFYLKSVNLAISKLINFFLISLNLVLESTIPFAKKYHNCCDFRAMYNSPAVDTVDSVK